MNEYPKLTGFAGKGGVGKSTSGLAYAFSRIEQGKKVVVVDYDGGHSIPRILGMNDINSNEIVGFNSDLSVAVIDPIKFQSIYSIKDKGGNVKDYLNQFIGQQGIVGFYDMLFRFFGILGDNDSVSKLGYFVDVVNEAKVKGVDEIVLDVEPTAGLERLLGSTNNFIESLRKLSNGGLVLLSILGAKWPDIKAFLSGDYMKKDFELCMLDLSKVSNFVKSSDFYGVCIPEYSPVDEMLEDVTKVLSNSGVNIKGYVVNRVSSDLSQEETLEIDRVNCAVENISGSLFKCPSDSKLNNRDPNVRLQALNDLGRVFH